MLFAVMLRPLAPLTTIPFLLSEIQFPATVAFTTSTRLRAVAAVLPSRVLFDTKMRLPAEMAIIEVEEEAPPVPRLPANVTLSVLEIDTIVRLKSFPVIWRLDEWRISILFRPSPEILFPTILA